MKILIISGGAPPNLNLLKQEATGCSYVIAADGGANCLCDYDFLPHLVIGDLDSIKPESIKFFKTKNIPIEQHPKNKDCTDTRLALDKAIALSATEIIFLGCIGGERIDHFISNIGLLIECLKYKIKASIKDNNNIITVLDKLDKNISITGAIGKLFSLCAYSDLVTGLTITGAKFNLSNYDLKPEDSITLSNEFLDTAVKITFKGGKLLLIRQHDNYTSILEKTWLR
jgi:thiamine pyrophosphokinase